MGQIARPISDSYGSRSGPGCISFYGWRTNLMQQKLKVEFGLVKFTFVNLFATQIFVLTEEIGHSTTSNF